MRNWEHIKGIYLRLDRPKQMGNLASGLSRISRNLQWEDEAGNQVAWTAIEECQHLSEWLITMCQMETDEHEWDLAQQLLEIGRQISQWKHQWQECSHNEVSRRDMATQALQWSEWMLERSGLLVVES